jgi:hypothetical protein
MSEVIAEVPPVTTGKQSSTFVPIVSKVITKELPTQSEDDIKYDKGEIAMFVSHLW